jgi:hypothetical protein
MPRRYARWKEALGCSVAGLWPIAITLGVLRNPSRYNPFALYSGFGSFSFRSVPAFPTTDPNVYATAYTLGTHSASQLAHGHLPWWNPFEGLGAPLIGELQSGGLFPFTLLYLFHDGSLVFHLSLEVVAGVATYWLLREFRCSPLVAAIGGMLFATNGTYSWLANAAFNPLCFLPIMILGVERARRAAAEGRGGGWRWLAVGTAFALIAGFIETAALGLIFVVVIAVQRGFAIERAKVLAYVRKATAGFAAGIAIASPVLVAFGDYLRLGFVAEHAGNAAAEKLNGAYMAMSVSPYLFGRVLQSKFPINFSLWGAVGGYAGFALMALAVASLFGKRDRGLRIVIATWVVFSLADSVGAPVIHQAVASMPFITHIVLYRYLPATWELGLVILAAFAIRDFATSSRAESVVAVSTGLLVTSGVLLVGMYIGSSAVAASRALTPTSFHLSELIVVTVIVGLLLASLAPSKVRGVLAGAIVVTEAAVLFAIPLSSWPTHVHVDTRAERFLVADVGSARIFGFGVPSANFGTLVGISQLDAVDLPVPKAFASVVANLDPYENPTAFTGVHVPFPNAPSSTALLFQKLPLYQEYGVRFIVAPTRIDLFRGRHVAKLVYHDAQLEVWRLNTTHPLVSAPGCSIIQKTQDSYVTRCSQSSLLQRTQLYFPGWSATVDGTPVTVQDRGLLQAIVIPKGRSTVAFTFLPPGIPEAGVAALIAVLTLLVPWELLTVRLRRRREKVLRLAGLEAIAATLASAAALNADDDRPPDPSTGVIAVTNGADENDEQPTSSVPVLAAEPSLATGEAPTSAVAVVETAASPVEPSPVEPSPVEPSSVEPSSVEPSSVEPSSVEPPSVEPPSVEPPSVEPPSVEPPSVEPLPKEDPPTIAVPLRRPEGECENTTSA